MTAPDVVYVVRSGERNEELRYSLRSLANLPHGKVWIAGYCPSWLDGVGIIRAPKRPPGHQQTKANLRAACEHPEVSEEFVYMNDDFFVMQPMDALPVMHRGTIADVVRSRHMATSYTRALQKVQQLLEERGIAEPLMYDLHAPMLVTKAGMLEALDTATSHLMQERTLFGNLQQLGGERRQNHKIRRRDKGWQSWPFLSTADSTFPRLPVGQLIRDRFPTPSPWETSPPPPDPLQRRVFPARRPVRRRAAMRQAQLTAGAAP